LRTLTRNGQPRRFSKRHGTRFEQAMRLTQQDWSTLMQSQSEIHPHPHFALRLAVAFCQLCEAAADEPFGDVQITLRIGRQAMRAIELA
jgi:hypothetical protein